MHQYQLASEKPADLDLHCFHSRIYYIPIKDTTFELSVFFGHLIQKVVSTN